MPAPREPLLTWQIGLVYLGKHIEKYMCIGERYVDILLDDAMDLDALLSKDAEIEDLPLQSCSGGVYRCVIACGHHSVPPRPGAALHIAALTRGLGRLKPLPAVWHGPTIYSLLFRAVRDRGLDNLGTKHMKLLQSVVHTTG